MCCNFQPAMPQHAVGSPTKARLCNPAHVTLHTADAPLMTPWTMCCIQEQPTYPHAWCIGVPPASPGDSAALAVTQAPRASVGLPGLRLMRRRGAQALPAHTAAAAVLRPAAEQPGALPSHLRSWADSWVADLMQAPHEL